jgi:hypothetical protein
VREDVITPRALGFDVDLRSGNYARTLVLAGVVVFLLVFAVVYVGYTTVPEWVGVTP